MSCWAGNFIEAYPVIKRVNSPANDGVELAQRMCHDGDDLSMRTQLLSCAPAEDGKWHPVGLEHT